MDILLDQEGVEVDPVNRIEGETPLHSAVKYARHDPEYGAFLAEVLVDAGADPRIRNKAGLKPIEIADSENEKLIDTLQGAEFAATLGVKDTKENSDAEEHEEGEGEESE